MPKLEAKVAASANTLAHPPSANLSSCALMLMRFVYTSGIYLLMDSDDFNTDSASEDKSMAPSKKTDVDHAELARKGLSIPPLTRYPLAEPHPQEEGDRSQPAIKSKL